MLFVCLLLINRTAVQPIQAQEDTGNADSSYQAQAVDLLTLMSPAERVGQLFVVTFTGDTLTADSPLAQLIADYHIGGVVLTAENDNFSDNEDVVRQTRRLTGALQELAVTGQLTILETNPDAETVEEPEEGDLELTRIPEPIVTPLSQDQAIPLFVGIYGSENGRPPILDETIVLPNTMSLGATWDPAHATKIGKLHGEQLEALGFNLLLAPTLDVLGQPQIVSPQRPLTQFWGGNPYWVGQMGQGYITGVHTGSDGHVATIAGLFPGSGYSDRTTYDEIATVRKSLTQLENDELVPFTAVTHSGVLTETVDGLMSGHLRYQGLQGNIGTNTPPFSFDPQALNTLLALPNFASWRKDGGLMMSDALGVPAVARFYDSSGGDFPHRQVAKDALFAGNDLLFTASFTADGTSGADHLANIEDTLTWFQDRYQTDPAFQARVDEAVLRILQKKLSLYQGAFPTAIEPVIADNEEGVSLLPEINGAMFGVAQDAITLLAPTAEELQERLPNPPTAQEDIVIFTEMAEQQQCQDCARQRLIEPDELGDQIVNLYGPSGSGQIEAGQIRGFQLDDLAAYLASPRPIIAPTNVLTEAGELESRGVLANVPPAPPAEAFAVQQALDTADWIIVVLLDNQVDVVQQLLNEAAVWQDTKLIVYAFGSPVHLDSTDVSKLTAYFGVYDHHPSFIDAAARSLFRDLTLSGSPPISLEVLGYDLNKAVQPDPEQIIELSSIQNIDLEGESEAVEEPGSSQPLPVKPGDRLALQTGQIVDHYGRPVPDGTMVQFIQEDRVQNFFDIIGTVTTIDGVARFDYVLENRPGQFRLRVVSGEATTSEEVDIAIEAEGGSVVVITPTPEPVTPTPTPTPTETATPLPTVTPTVTPTLAVVLDDSATEPELQISLTEIWHIGAMLLGLVLLLVVNMQLPLVPTIRIRILSWGWILGLCGYIYFTLGQPGFEWLPDWGNWRSLLVTFVCGLIGLLLSLISVALETRRELRHG